jgi:hypothetical protein
MNELTELLRRKRFRGRAVWAILGGMTLALLPGVAFATAPTITVVAGTPQGAPAALAYATSSADCGSTHVVTGGGIFITTDANGNSDSNAQHVGASGPGSAAGQFSANSSTGARYWIGVDGSGGMKDTSAGAGMVAYGLCDDSNWTGGTTIVSVTQNSPTTSLTVAPVTAGCPSGKQLLSGGGWSAADPANGSLKLIASYPSFSGTNHDKPAKDTATNPNSWTAIGWTGGMSGGSDYTTVWAVCAANSFMNTVKQAYMSGPNTASAAGPAVNVQCGTSGSLIGGGFSVDGENGLYNGTTAFVGDPSSGDHAVESAPTDSSGNLLSSGTSATGWTAKGHAGGTHSGTSYTHVWAMCAS